MEEMGRQEMVWQEMERWAKLVTGQEWIQKVMPGLGGGHQQWKQDIEGMVDCLGKIWHIARF